MEWYAEIGVRFGGELDPSSEAYTETVERFYDRLSEYLGGEEFEPSMLCRRQNLETYAYVEAKSPEEAAALALRPFRESAEAVWGPGTTAEVLRVIEAEERDRELEDEVGATDVFYDPQMRRAVEEAEAEIDRGEGLSFRQAFGE